MNELNNDYSIDDVNTIESYYSQILSNTRNSFDLDYSIFSLQSYVRYILGFIIISNFLLIFIMKFLISKKNKIAEFIKENNSKLIKNDMKQDDTNGNTVTENNDIENKKHCILIIAHPDDELMFFYPTLKFLMDTNLIINIILLSDGGYYKLGNERKKEFLNLLNFLGIKDYKIYEYKDDINSYYDSNDVCNTISNYISEKNIMEKLSCIFTFDEKGVSNHPNHISCCNGLM